MRPPRPAIQAQWNNFKAVRDDSRTRSFGIERLIRFFLVLTAFIFPTLYVRHISGKKSAIARKIAIEIIVAVKLFLPLVYLYFDVVSKPFILALNFYFMAETILYLLAIIFLSDIYVPPTSFKRSFLLLFMNYIELNLCFAVVYRGLDLIAGIKSDITAIYFSFVTFTTLGYGDFQPETHLGQSIVVIHLLVMILFIALFFSSLSPKFAKSNRAK